MLLQFVSFPTQSGFDGDEFALYVNHLQILMPVVLSHEKAYMDVTRSMVAQDALQIVSGFSAQDDEDVENAAALLDQGLPLAYFSVCEDSERLTSVLSSLPRHRVGVCIAPHGIEDLRSVIMQYRSLVHGFTIKLTDECIKFCCVDEVLETLLVLLKEPSHSIEICVQTSYATANKFATKTEKLHAMVVPGMKEGKVQLPLYFHHFSLTAQPGGDDLIDLFVSTLRSDRTDGLYTTLVCDETHTCLGVVYSNADTLRIAFVSQRGVYWSRSRQQIWRKGESSGMTQILLSMRHDCDRDAVRMTVRQLGEPAAFCHLNTRTCFGEDRGLSRLERTLQERLRSAPPGSYTQRLFQDEALLREKLLEEAQELVEAKEKSHVAAEAADLMYFLLVRCVAAGVSLADIERNLDQKSLKIHRRPGNAKEWRTRDAEKILQETTNK